ncbi:MAG: hypothetical protein IRY87_28000 [Acetobacteraceae bacterium]|nr:hypothetical protein [Acetobacteraceae bacterium]
MTGTLATRIGAFAASFTAVEMTAEEARLVRRALLDTIACALGGLREPPTAMACAMPAR